MQPMIGFDNDFSAQVDTRKPVHEQNGMFMFRIFTQKIFTDVYM